jgi:hypothetical protein
MKLKFNFKCSTGHKIQNPPKPTAYIQNMFRYTVYLITMLSGLKFRRKYHNLSQQSKI